MQFSMVRWAERARGRPLPAEIANRSAPDGPPLLWNAPSKATATGTVLFREGETASQVLELTAGGVVKLYRLMPDGRRQVTGFLYPRSLFGMCSNGQYIATAEAVSDCFVRAYPRAALSRVIEADPFLTSRLLTSASEELAFSQDQMLLLGRKTAAERVATFLVRMAERHSLSDEAQPMIELPMCQSDIADYLGLTSETVCRMLKSLRREETIRYASRRAVLLLRMDRLRELASGELGAKNDCVYPSAAMPKVPSARQPGRQGGDAALHDPLGGAGAKPQSPAEDSRRRSAQAARG
jgi:CRP/FNR family transcriptional regulator